MRKQYFGMLIAAVLVSAVVSVGAQYWAPMPVEGALSTVIPNPSTAGLTCYPFTSNLRVLQLNSRTDVLAIFERVESGGTKSLCFLRTDIYAFGWWRRLDDNWVPPGPQITQPQPQTEQLPQPVLFGGSDNGAAHTNRQK